MRNLLFILLFVLSPYAVPSCDELLKSTSGIPGGTIPLSNSEIIEGLKTALKVGTDSSVSVTSRLNGFYKDEAIKILLPPEAAIIYENKDNALIKAAGIDKKIEEAIMALNRAAEDAASEAGPIFKNAIMGMSITDGLSILRGNNPASDNSTSSFDSTAATAYLKSNTFVSLRDAFSPKINSSLDKKLVGNFSANQVWNGLTGSYNIIAQNSFGMVKPVSTVNLSDYVTENALNGIFYKVANEEIKIRRDPWKWAQTSVGNILEKVFGSRST